MGTTKSEIFTTKQNNLAQIAKALGHPARIAILEHLMVSKTCICGDLVNEIGLAQPTISQHLKELKSVGFIKGTIEGTKVCYCIDDENWSRFKSIITTFFDTIVDKENTCC